MSRSWLWRAPVLVLLIAAAGCGRETQQTDPPPRPPNLLVIVADDLGSEQVGIYDEPGFAGRTPNLDRLGREGLVFERFWSMPSCSPTRAALLTGEYPSRNGIGYIVEGDPGGGRDEALKRFGLPETAFTLPRALVPAGYSSAIVGKWDVASIDQGPGHPLRAGFDHHRGSFGNLWTGYFRWMKSVDGSDEVAEVYATTDTTDDAIALAGELAEPWLIVVSYNAPHAPAHVPPAALHGFGELDPDAQPVRTYRAMVEAMDSEIGRLLAATAAHDPFTLFLGDNGTPGWVTASGARRRRGKGSVYEGGIHVPFLVNHASIGSPGRRVSGVAGVTDVFATLVELSGSEVAPERMPRDSVSLVPYLRSTAAPPVRDWIYSETFWPNGHGPRQRHARAARDQRYKLVRRDAARSELYDLVEDPEEKHPLRDPSGQAAAAMARLERLVKELPAVRAAAR